MSADEHEFDRAQLLALTRVLYSNPTIADLTPQARAGYFAATSTIDSIAHGMPVRHVRAGTPVLPAVTDAALVEDMWASSDESGSQ